MGVLRQLDSKRMTVRELLVDTIARLDDGSVVDPVEAIIIIQKKIEGVELFENGLKLETVIYMCELSKHCLLSQITS
jgi:hypothetical protein